MLDNISIDVFNVPIITGSTPVMSHQWNTLAKSWNQRREGGFGDIIWRTFYNTCALLRNKNNNLGAGSGTNFLFKNYFTGSSDDPNSIDPNSIFNTKPPLNQFTFGATTSPSSAANLNEEGYRLTHYTSSVVDINVMTLSDPNDPEQCYSQSRLMQGGYDKNTDDTDSPSVFLPRQNNQYYITNQDKSVYNSWGGFPPSREVIGICYDNDPDKIPFIYPNRLIKFTNIKTSVQDVYNGTCNFTLNNHYISLFYPDSSSKFTRNVFHVYKKNGIRNDITTDTLIKSYNMTEWTEGPYEGSGAGVGKTVIFPLYESLINSYCKNFRGEQNYWNSQSFSILSQSFQSQDFFENKYLLAPHRGTASYDGQRFVSCSIQPVIYTMTGLGTHNSESYFMIGASNTASLHSGFAFTKLYVKVQNVTGSIVLEVADSSSVNPTWSFYDIRQNIDTGTSGSSIQVLHPAITYISNSVGNIPNISIKLKKDIEIGTGGYINIFMDELKDYNPDIFDLYWVLRLGSFSSQVIGQDAYAEDIISEIYPYNDSKGKDIWNFYNNSGSILPVYGQSSLSNTVLGGNSVFNEYVKGPLSWIRYIKPLDIIGYEANTISSSIYISNNALSYINTLININDYADTGIIKTGWKYLITGSVSGGVYTTGSILYNNINYTTNDYFKGVWKQEVPSQVTGSPTIMLINNIINSGSYLITSSVEGVSEIRSGSAPEQGHSNEWLCLPQQYPWGPNYYSEDIPDPGGDWIENTWSTFYLDKTYYNKSLFNRMYEQHMDVIFNQGGLDVNYVEGGILTADLYGNNNQDYVKQEIIMTPEFPSGWSYYTGTTDDDLQMNAFEAGINVGEYGDYFNDEEEKWIAYCKSNIIYKPPYKLKEINTNATLFGIQCIKIDYVNRWHRHEDAPASVMMSDIINWNNNQQEYRTDENAIMDWLIYRYLQEDGVTWTFTQLGHADREGKITRKVGEFYSRTYKYFSSYTSPFASIPTGLIFSKNIPMVYEDLNIEYNEQDTRVEVNDIIQLEYDIKSGCEGFASEGLDTKTLVNLFNVYTGLDNPVEVYLYSVPGYSNLADWYYQKLLYKTTGKCIGIVTTKSQDKKITAYGLTPLPHCIITVDQYNNFAKMVNACDKVRLMIPFQVQTSQNLDTIPTTNLDPEYGPYYGRSTQTASFNGSVIDYQTVHIPANTDWANLPNGYSLQSTVDTGFINKSFVGNAIANMGYTFDARSYAFGINEVYRNALPYNLPVNLSSLLKIFAVSRLNWNIITTYWSDLAYGIDCINGDPQYQQGDYKPCDIFQEGLGFLHGGTTPYSSISSYISPGAADISLSGTGIGDALWLGQRDIDAATITQFDISRTVFLMKNCVVLQLNLI